MVRGGVEFDGVEVDRAVGLVGVVVGDDLLDEGDDLGHVLADSGQHVSGQYLGEKEWRVKSWMTENTILSTV